MNQGSRKCNVVLTPNTFVLSLGKSDNIGQFTEIIYMSLGIK